MDLHKSHLNKSNDSNENVDDVETILNEIDENYKV